MDLVDSYFQLCIDRIYRYVQTEWPSNWRPKNYGMRQEISI